MSLTKKAPNGFVSAESVGGRKIGGFRLNLHIIENNFVYLFRTQII